MRWWKYILMSILLISLGACSGFEKFLTEFESSEPAESAETTVELVGDVERGREIFREGLGDAQRCANCHRVTTRGFAVDAGPNLEGIADKAGDRIEGMSAEAYFRESMLNPSAFIVEVFRTPMPEDYAALLSDQDVADLIAYMMQLTLE